MVNGCQDVVGVRHEFNIRIPDVGTERREESESESFPQGRRLDHEMKMIGHETARALASSS